MKYLILLLAPILLCSCKVKENDKVRCVVYFNDNTADTLFIYEKYTIVDNNLYNYRTNSWIEDTSIVAKDVKYIKELPDEQK